MSTSRASAGGGGGLAAASAGGVAVAANHPNLMERLLIIMKLIFSVVGTEETRGVAFRNRRSKSQEDLASEAEQIKSGLIELKKAYAEVKDDLTVAAGGGGGSATAADAEADQAAALDVSAMSADAAVMGTDAAVMATNAATAAKKAAAAMDGLTKHLLHVFDLAVKAIETAAKKAAAYVAEKATLIAARSALRAYRAGTGNKELLDNARTAYRKAKMVFEKVFDDGDRQGLGWWRGKDSKPLADFERSLVFLPEKFLLVSNTNTEVCQYASLASVLANNSMAKEIAVYCHDCCQKAFGRVEQAGKFFLLLCKNLGRTETRGLAENFISAIKDSKAFFNKSKEVIKDATSI